MAYFLPKYGGGGGNIGPYGRFTMVACCMVPRIGPGIGFGLFSASFSTVSICSMVIRMRPMRLYSCVVDGKLKFRDGNGRGELDELEYE